MRAVKTANSCQEKSRSSKKRRGTSPEVGLQLGWDKHLWASSAYPHKSPGCLRYCEFNSFTTESEVACPVRRWSFLIMTATRAVAREEEVTWEPCSSAPLKRSRIPWHSWPCPLLLSLCLWAWNRFVLLCQSMCAASGEATCAPLGYEADFCTSLPFQTFSDCEIKLLLLLKANWFKHVRPKWGEPIFLPVIHTHISQKQKKRVNPTFFAILILLWRLMAIYNQNYFQ